MRPLVTGGREFRDLALLEKTLDDLHSKSVIQILIHGGARGADTMAHLWALKKGVQPARCDANWDYYKSAAGPKRNLAMLYLHPDLVLAFPGGTGTSNMVKLAKANNIEVIQIKESK